MSVSAPRHWCRYLLGLDGEGPCRSVIVSLEDGGPLARWPGWITSLTRQSWADLLPCAVMMGDMSFRSPVLCVRCETEGGYIVRTPLADSLERITISLLIDSHTNPRSPVHPPYTSYLT
jgi:hypothetical protein